MLLSRQAILLPALVLSFGLPPACAGAPTAEQLEFFEKRIRPILVDTCGTCHGVQKQKGSLRLDSKSALLSGGDTGPAVVPGAPEISLLIKAVGYRDEELRMPPKGKLADEKIADLAAWIKMGAPWPEGNAPSGPAKLKPFDLKERLEHWCWQPALRLPLPRVKNQAWLQSPVDAFILAALETRGLEPAPPADKRSLLRRVTFDLIGLPPTADEINAFIADESPGAFAQVVDRLLASPHYGERWARHWLDLARYAETFGHEMDFEITDAYGYRDYVIRAFNADVPYNDFVTEQIAGDLLPRPRKNPAGSNESILGTGFWYLGEATHSPVDVRADESNHIDNQIDVFGKTFLGLTLACARCHDHKFDAISTRDYYALAGYLKSSRLQRAFIDAQELWLPHHELLCAARQECLAEARAWTSAGLSELPAEVSKTHPTAHASLTKHPDEVFEDFGKPTYENWYVTGNAFGAGPGQIGDFVLHAADRPPIQHILEAPAAHSGLVSPALQGALRSASFVISKKKICYHAAGRGCRINLIVDGYQLIRDPIYGGLTVQVNNGDTPAWHVQDVAMWQGEQAYIEILDDGSGYIAVDRIVFADDAPRSETRGNSDDFIERIRSSIADFRNDRLHGAAAVDRIAALNDLLKRKSTALQETTLDQPLAAKLRHLEAIEAALPSPRRARAMADGTGWNEHLHIRGNARNVGVEVPRRNLEAFAAGNVETTVAGSGRLELARRLVRGDNPLVARVLVNRLWQHHFGEGIVRSPDNFGVLGERPSHPELLDYLATELVQRNWSIKEMHRLLLLSSTYQMSSRPTEPAETIDPQNRYLHRMPLRRLEAECIRDALLCVAGRFDSSMFGPSVPVHLTAHMAGRGRPGNSGPLDGAGRRSIYLALRRNFLPPMLLAFDFPIPFTTIGRRGVSNVPAQALTLLNNPLVVQMADRWAKHVLAEPRTNASARIETMYISAFARPPTEEERAAALAFIAENTKVKSPDGEVRAWSDLAHVLFNVKEFAILN